MMTKKLFVIRGSCSLLHSTGTISVAVDYLDQRLTAPDAVDTSAAACLNRHFLTSVVARVVVGN